MVDKSLDQMHCSNSLPKAGRYQHYKGQYYQVLYCARHSETEEWFVVYQCLYGDHGIWVRPASMFVESVTLSSQECVARFTYIASA